MVGSVYVRVLSEQELGLLRQEFRLSARQIEIARLISQGMSDRQIAGQLGISFGTVRSHMSRLFQKCRVNNRLQLLAHVYGRLHTTDARSSPHVNPPRRQY